MRQIQIFDGRIFQGHTYPTKIESIALVAQRQEDLGLANPRPEHKHVGRILGFHSFLPVPYLCIHKAVCRNQQVMNTQCQLNVCGYLRNSILSCLKPPS